MKKTPPPEHRFAGECLAGRVRVLNRVVTGLYDDALRPYGVRVSQMNVLACIAVLGPVRATDVCDRLRLEKSTLSRDLDRLLDRKWVRITPGEGRNQLLELTPAGRALIAKLTPAWEGVQRKLQTILGEDLTRGIFDAVDRLRAADSEGE